MHKVYSGLRLFLIYKFYGCGYCYYCFHNCGDGVGYGYGLGKGFGGGEGNKFNDRDLGCGSGFYEGYGCGQDSGQTNDTTLLFEEK